MAKFDIREFARVGAAARLEQLDAERAAIYRNFPDLRSVMGPGRGSEVGNGRTTARGPGRGSEVGNGRARRRPMSAAEKKAVSLRMKKYWAGRRREKAAAAK